MLQNLPLIGPICSPKNVITSTHVHHLKPLSTVNLEHFPSLHPPRTNTETVCVHLNAGILDIYLYHSKILLIAERPFLSKCSAQCCLANMLCNHAHVARSGPLAFMFYVWLIYLSLAYAPFFDISKLFYMYSVLNNTRKLM